MLIVPYLLCLLTITVHDALLQALHGADLCPFEQRLLVFSL